MWAEGCNDSLNCSQMVLTLGGVKHAGVESREMPAVDSET